LKGAASIRLVRVVDEAARARRWRPSESSRPRRVRAAVQPLSTGFELADHRLRGVMPLVPRGHLPVLLAGPAPSGSPDASRRCRGCLPPSRRLPVRAAPSFLTSLRRPQGKGLSPPLGSMAPRGAQHPRPTRRSRSWTVRRSRPQRPPWPGSQPAVTAATLGAWVGDGRQVGQQVTGLGHLQRDGIGKLGEGRWDRG
jgi:hypothetical protein